MSRRRDRLATALLALAMPLSIAAADEVAAQRNTIVMHVDGMSCPSGCAARVARALKALPGVEEVTSRFAKREFDVRFDPTRVTTARLLETVSGLRFRPTLRPGVIAAVQTDAGSVEARAAEALRPGQEVVVRVRAAPRAGAGAGTPELTATVPEPLAAAVGPADAPGGEGAVVVRAPETTPPGERTLVVRVTWPTGDAVEVRVPLSVTDAE